MDASSSQMQNRKGIPSKKNAKKNANQEGGSEPCLVERLVLHRKFSRKQGKWKGKGARTDPTPGE